MATSKPKRVFIFIAAMLFLISSVGLTGLVIWELIQQNSNTPETSQQQENTPQAGNTLKGTNLDNFEPIDKTSKLEVEDIKAGTGKEASKDSTVEAHYTGAIAKTGVIFESSHDSGQPATFPLSDVIKGWQEGVPGMKEGGTRRLIIPAALAYGEASPSPDIPANSDLVFDIELISVK